MEPNKNPIGASDVNAAPGTTQNAGHTVVGGTARSMTGAENQGTIGNAAPLAGPKDTIQAPISEPKAATAAPVMEEEFASISVQEEPVSPDSGAMSFGAGEKKKSKGALALCIALLVMLAAGGIGFGVWAMMDGNTKQANYEKQISNLRTQNDELMSKLENSDIDDCVLIDDDEGDGTGENSSEYVYIGEWGLKIRIPDGLKKVSYVVSATPERDEETVCVSGVASSENVFPDFANLRKNYPGLGCVNRVLKGAEYHGASLVFSDDLYEYIYVSPQAVYSVSEDEQKLEAESLQLVSQMLTSENNYSKF